jgi:hypothetical protein
MAILWLPLFGLFDLMNHEKEKSIIRSWVLVQGFASIQVAAPVDEQDAEF